ncbi:MAG: SAM-dependent chlorinase/fluorinase [Chloroflexi bacterium]|nr:SAM-dependent chlorinase/fluorinase [Chloroflexota bacterium]
MSCVITLTTDFGYRDAYVAAMKGAILSIEPSATIVDITHDVPPQDILHGAFVLSAAFSYFPQGTVHVAVVDPGVGTDRLAIGVEWRGHRFVAPDNGVTSLALAAGADSPASPAGATHEPYDGPLPAGAVAHELTDSRYHLADVSSTFHGRDIFAPVAAHLAAGVPLSRMGPALSSVRRLGLASPSVGKDGTVRCAVIHVDGFGNLVTSARREHLSSGACEVEVGGRRVPGLSRSYGDGEGVLALWGSAGYLEVAVKNGNAARTLGVSRGDEVVITVAEPHRYG